jgi:hypothetical protein
LEPGDELRDAGLIGDETKFASQRADSEGYGDSRLSRVGRVRVLAETEH